MSSQIETTVQGSGKGSGKGESGDGASGAAQFDAEDSMVNFEESALFELEIDGTQYRMDAGRAGTALCISTRPQGSWSWVFRGEARWQAKVLRCKAFDREVLLQLSKALEQAAADSAGS